MRKQHRQISVIAVPFLLVAAITGLLWAYAPHLYWKDDYLKKNVPSGPVDRQEVRISFEEAAQAAERHGVTAVGVSLRKEAGHTVYAVTGDVPQGGTREILIDAVTGKTLTPLSEELAIEIAMQYVNSSDILAVDRIPSYHHRSGKDFLNVTAVRFKDSNRTSIYLSESGNILEDEDRTRVFHFWVMKLHKLNFFGTKKELTAIPGIALILLIITGLSIWKQRLRGL